MADKKPSTQERLDRMEAQINELQRIVSDLNPGAAFHTIPKEPPRLTYWGTPKNRQTRKAGKHE